VRRFWKGKLIIKGLLHIADVQLAHDAGADAVIISNHGGRQLSFASSPSECLPEIRRQFPTYDIMVDGGVMSGSDVAKLLGMGATAVGLGRSYLYGLAALGEPGVKKAIRIIHQELRTSHILLGHSPVSAILH
jgi:L-lactate dehydrogenase (cytochrome)